MIYVMTPCPLATQTIMHPRLLRCYFGKFQWRSSVDQGVLASSIRGHTTLSSFRSTDDLDSQQLQSYDNAIGGPQHIRSVANGVPGSPRPGEQLEGHPGPAGQMPACRLESWRGARHLCGSAHCSRATRLVPLISARQTSYPINVAHGRRS